MIICGSFHVFLTHWLLVSRYISLWSNKHVPKIKLRVSSCWRCCFKSIYAAGNKSLYAIIQQKFCLCWNSSQTESACKSKKLETTRSTSDPFSDWLELHEKGFNVDWRCYSNLLCLQRWYRSASGFGVLQQI